MTKISLSLAFDDKNNVLTFFLCFRIYFLKLKIMFSSNSKIFFKYNLLFIVCFKVTLKNKFSKIFIKYR